MGRFFAYCMKYRSNPARTSSDVILGGAGLTLHHWTPYPGPANNWERFVIPLSPDESRVNAGNGPVASDAEFLSVLGNVTSLRIHADYRLGPELVDLDNVVI